jgi:hypothetical protein
MNFDDLRIGMKVYVGGSTFTARCQGMDDIMHRLVGTQQTISEFDPGGEWIKFVGHVHFWDHRDMKEIPDIDENLIKLHGKKSVFDPTELH